ncbi:MAG: FG-GAP repeat protein [Alphaproteobacteria bacterium]|nr:FG-GAP repeat protein [Alphaproteobacteria bacterium]
MTALVVLLWLVPGCLMSPKDFQALMDGVLDSDGDGHVNADFEGEGGDDCDDDNAATHPGADELCDGEDNDCDGTIDEGRSDWEGLWRDLDADGYGDPDNPLTFCPIPADAVADATDCDDGRPAINPAQTDVVGDGLDQNCDDVDGTDGDGDGWASVASGGADCDDADASVNPGATEGWYDGADQNCDGASDYDADVDGHDSVDYGGDDCDDLSAAVHPGTPEIWYDGTDQDCAGDNDYDADLDGEDADAFGGTDCDDADSGINASATELCDGVDQNCDGIVDNDATDGTTFYADTDGDTYGDPNSTQSACSQPSGFVTDDTDCDDTDASTNPGGTEVGYDLVDNDCNGNTDDMDAAAEASHEVHGIALNDAVASTVLLTSDLNGDGDPEFILGIPGLDANGVDAGAVALFDSDTLGSSQGANSNYSLVLGTSQSDLLGYAISFLGDVDGDGSAELAIGAPYSDLGGTDAGTVYLIDLGVGSSHTGGSVVITPDGTIQGGYSSGHYGSSASSGDLDGDGLSDLAVGATGELSFRGGAYVHLASDAYQTANDLNVALSSTYFITSTYAQLGSSVDLSGDVTGDGYSDFVACGGFHNTDAGRCWVVAGLSTPGFLNERIENHDTANFSGNAGDELGVGQHMLATADVNGDNIDDILIGSASAASGNGEVYVFLGGASLSGSYTAATDADVILGGDGAFGTAIQAGVDVDGDGNDDVLIGATTGGAATAGVVYLIPGPLSGASYALPGDEIASWHGTASGDQFGAAISGLFDLDGDINGEFAVAAPGNDDARPNTGKVYILPAY